MTWRLTAELLAIVVPPACVACLSPLPRAGLLLCSACTRALPWLPRRVCPRCALPFHRRACPAAGAAFGRAWAPLAYDGVARELVAALKFRAALPLAHLMAAHIAANLPPDLRPAGMDPYPGARGREAAVDRAPVARARARVAVVPVPAQPARRRRRGFDPAAQLAAALAPRLGVPQAVCLRRLDRGGRQVGSSRSQRRRAGRLAIEIRAPPPARALLVDDVHTTGATLDACARALLAGGCREVVALAYARTL
jgi:predicted amidophosphoribosyltransferase